MQNSAIHFFSLGNKTFLGWTCSLKADLCESMKAAGEKWWRNDPGHTELSGWFKELNQLPTAAQKLYFATGLTSGGSLPSVSGCDSWLHTLPVLPNCFPYQFPLVLQAVTPWELPTGASQGSAFASGAACSDGWAHLEPGAAWKCSCHCQTWWMGQPGTAGGGLCATKCK